LSQGNSISRHIAGHKARHFHTLIPLGYLPLEQAMPGRQVARAVLTELGPAGEPVRAAERADPPLWEYFDEMAADDLSGFAAPSFSEALADRLRLSLECDLPFSGRSIRRQGSGCGSRQL
jgi:hypothetical protein